MSQAAFERILAALHKAALDDAHWLTASALIDEACAVKGNLLGFGAGESQDEITMFFTRMCYRGQRHEELERVYFKTYHRLDERLPRLRLMPDSQLVHVSDLFTDQEKRTSVVYNEALPMSNSKDSLNVRLDGPNASRIIWNLADPVDGNGWSFNQIETIQRILPHLRQFVTIRQALAEARALGQSLMGLLDNTRIGVIQLDRNARILEANDHARTILRHARGLSDRDGCLHALIPKDNDVLQGMLARALVRFGGQGVAGSMMVQGKSGLARLVVHVNPVGGQYMDFRPQGVAALVVVIDPAHRLRIDPKRVVSLFGLTPVEGQVAVLLGEGRTVREIARMLARKQSTVRWHMKHIFTKLKVSRQVELVQLVQSLARGADPSNDAVLEGAQRLACHYFKLTPLFSINPFI